MKKRIRKSDIINVNLNTYKGVRKAITSWLEMGTRINMTAEFGRTLKYLKNQLEASAAGSKELQDGFVSHFKYLLTQMPGQAVLAADNKPLYYYDTKDQGRMKARVSLKAQKIAKPKPGSVNTLNDILSNWNGIENEMIDYDFFKNALFNLFKDYEEWKERFKEAAGLGNTSDEVFKVLMAVYENKHDLFFLQGYMLKHGIKIGIDNAIEDIEVAMMDIYEMDDKKAEDYRALDLFDKFRKALS